MTRKRGKAMPSFEIEFEVHCEKCGTELVSKFTTGYDSPEGFRMGVEPCSDCLESERQEGYDEGFDGARDEE